VSVERACPLFFFEDPPNPPIACTGTRHHRCARAASVDRGPHADSQAAPILIKLQSTFFGDSHKRIGRG